MKKISVITTLIITLFSGYNLLSQDSTETEKDWEWDWEVDDWADWHNKKPTISVDYGFSDISRVDVEAPFTDNNLIELKLGYTNKRNSKYADYLERQAFNYMFLNRNTTELAGDPENASDIKTNNWQFGLAWSSGYGYIIGTNASITPYFTGTMNWTNIDFADDSLSANDERVKELYDETFRFGSSNEMGVRFQATQMIVLNAGYERAIVFERHLFWKWAGSSIIELAAHGLLDVFLKEIYKSSPAAGPIVFFVLKSALGYGLYELRQEKMNWPFDSAPPVAFDNIKFGVSFVF